MSGVSTGDILFILLIGGLIAGIMLLVNRSRQAKRDNHSPPPA